jgi:hypothetical protein
MNAVHSTPGSGILVFSSHTECMTNSILAVVISFAISTCRLAPSSAPTTAASTSALHPTTTARAAFLLGPARLLLLVLPLVLVRSRLRQPRLLARHDPGQVLLQKTPFFQRSLHVSRACLGTYSVFNHKPTPKKCFRTTVIGVTVSRPSSVNISSTCPSEARIQPQNGQMDLFCNWRFAPGLETGGNSFATNGQIDKSNTCGA